MAATYNFTGSDALCQGSTWSWSVTVKYKATGLPVDISGYTARMQLREFVNSSAVLLELTTENGRLAIDGTNGLVTATVSATDTAALSFTRAFYDLEIVNGAVVTRIMQGIVDLSKEVTR